MNYQKIRKALIILAGLIAIVVGAPCILFPIINRDWVPEATTARLPGASPEEVREILGEPTSIYTHPEGKQWIYYRGMYRPDFCVVFDTKDRVVSWHYDR